MYKGISSHIVGDITSFYATCICKIPMLEKTQLKHLKCFFFLMVLIFKTTVFPGNVMVCCNVFYNVTLNIALLQAIQGETSCINITEDANIVWCAHVVDLLWILKVLILTRSLYNVTLLLVFSFIPK